MEQEKMAQFAAENVIYNISYIPGEDEVSDLYLAVYEPLNISSYGSSKEEALSYAQEQLKSFLIGDTESLIKVLESIKR